MNDEPRDLKWYQYLDFEDGTIWLEDRTEDLCCWNMQFSLFDEWE